MANNVSSKVEGNKAAPTANGRASVQSETTSDLGLSQGIVQRVYMDPNQLTPTDVMVLQRTMGNDSVQRLLASRTKPQTPNADLATGVNTAPVIQPKTKVGAGDDEYEQEADALAQQITSTPAPVQRKVGLHIAGGPVKQDLVQRNGDLFGDAQKAEETGKVEGVRDLSVAKLTLENPTWDPNAVVNVAGKLEKGGWVEATPDRNSLGTRSEIGTSDAPKKVDKRMVAGATLDPSKRSEKLQSGRLTEDELKEITPEQVAHVNPLSDEPRKILKHTLHESWHHAKEVLLADGTNKKAREMLMAKLWEFRQWHYDMILRRTQADPEIGKAGLEEWKAAGSTTLTSDIDVNLKGNKTEKAVAVFNRLFKADGWKHEAGVVYDVNVYAVDFMHKDTFRGLAETRAGVERHDFGKDSTPTRVSAKEGARSGSKGGGVSQKSKMLEERMLKADADLQRVWSLVKMRLYMTGRQWQEYLRDAKVPKQIETAVNLRYDSYMNELKAKMLNGVTDIEQADEMENTGFAVLDSIARAKGERDGSDPEEVKMAASNRIYEQKLMQMAAVRETLQRQIKQYEDWLNEGQGEDAEALDAAIDGNLAILRDLISECAMFSNEAYVTDGAVNHTVVGLQSKIGITQTKSETMDAFNENVADSLKEIARHSSTLGEAAYKAGKYLWRMADAALNLGSKDKDVQLLYNAGYIVANEIKGVGDGSQVELETAAATALQTHLPRGAAVSPATLMEFVRRLSARVALKHSADLARNGQQRAEPVKSTKRP